MSQAQPESVFAGPTAGTGPVLSFKKRQNKAPPLLKSQSTNTNGDKTPVLGSPETTLGPYRKVLSRRKALQDFYKMNAVLEPAPEHVVENNENNMNHVKTPDFEAEKLLRKLSDENAMREFIKTADSHEILQARNAAADKLNLHDLERKSIIYNNYSELIKLNQILADVFDEKRDDLEFAHADDGGIVTHKTIDEYLAGLSGFLATEAAVFNQDFLSVVESLCLEIDGADSVSSVAGISGHE